MGCVTAAEGGVGGSWPPKCFMRRFVTSSCGSASPHLLRNSRTTRALGRMTALLRRALRGADPHRRAQGAALAPALALAGARPHLAIGRGARARGTIAPSGAYVV